MNPFVWRFIGGVSTAYAIDMMIPNYLKIPAQGLNVAIWGRGTFRGKAYESVGRQVVRGGKAIGRPVARAGGRVLMKVGGRMVPILGWGLLALEIGFFAANHFPATTDEDPWYSWKHIPPHYHE